MATTARPTAAPEVYDDATDRRRPSRLRRIGRRVGRLLAGLIVLALVAALVQAVLERRDSAAHPAPGEHVSLPDGRRLHLHVTGEQHDGPTVVLLAGAGASVSAWGWVLPAVAEHATVVAYDRAGIGWSDPSEAPTDPDAVVADLRAALAARGLPGPYVLAGHSLGAHHARAFVERRPDEVAGIVLIDPAHVGASEVMGMTMESMGPFFALMRALARFGGLRVYRAMEAEMHGLPQPERAQALAQFRSTGYWRAFRPEMVTLDQVGATLPEAPGVLGDIPVHVLIATGGAADAAQQRQLNDLAALREDLADLSTRGQTTTLPDATHVTIVTEREHAAVVADAIVDILPATPRAAGP